jgi:hypothetical protein
MTRRKPNLFLIGAMKSGTTYLRKLLNAHPDIFYVRPRRAELFCRPAAAEDALPRDVGTRPVAERGALSGSVPPRRQGADPRRGQHQLHHAATSMGGSQRIAAFNPEARFIYLLRDPVERTISHYWHVVRHHAEHRPIAEAVRRDPQFVAVSHYAMQLRPLLERFGHERVAVLIHEQLVADPRGVMGNLYRGLGGCVRVLRTRERDPRSGRRTRLGRNTTAAAAGPSPEGRHGPDSGIGPRSAASSDHAGSAPARHRPDRSGGIPASQAEAADRRLGGGARLQLPRMDNAVWHILLRDTDPAAGASPSASVDHREAIARATVTLGLLSTSALGSPQPVMVASPQRCL